MTKLIFISMLMICLSLNAQITNRTIEKEIIATPIEKPIEYDSLSNWHFKKYFKEYKQYIGQKVFLLKNSSTSTPFLFTKKKEMYSITKDLLKEGLKNEFVSPGKKEDMKGKNYYSKLILDSIHTNIYKPILNYGIYDNVYEYDIKKDFKVSNKGNEAKYYQIIDVLYGKEMRLLNLKTTYYVREQKLYSEKNKKYNEETNENFEKKIFKYGSGYAFLIRDINTSEELYFIGSPENYFLLVSYFVKMKEKYQNKYVISKNEFITKDIKRVEQVENYRDEIIEKNKSVNIKKDSRWFCEDITLLNDERKISIILSNENGEKIEVHSLEENSWILEYDFLKKKEEKEQLIENKKQEELNKITIQRNKIKEEYNQRLQKNITEFGEINGTLITEKKVKLGMTKRMCEVAWGKPYYKSKTETENGIISQWYYGSIKSLLFVNNKLKQLVE